MWSDPLAVSGGGAIEKISSRLLERSNLYYPPHFPRTRPLVLQAVKHGLGWHGLGWHGLGWREVGVAGIGVHVADDSASARWSPCGFMGPGLRAATRRVRLPLPDRRGASRSAGPSSGQRRPR